MTDTFVVDTTAQLLSELPHTPLDLATLRGGVLEDDMRIVVYDLDGTLFDITHRLHYMTKKPKNYVQFMREIPFDEPHDAIVHSLLMHQQYSQVFFLTGRSQNEREDTIAQIRKHIGEFDFDNCLIMREKLDYRSSVIYKQEALQDLLDEGYNIAACYDDQTDNCAMMADVVYPGKTFRCENGFVVEEVIGKNGVANNVGPMYSNTIGFYDIGRHVNAG